MTRDRSIAVFAFHVGQADAWNRAAAWMPESLATYARGLASLGLSIAKPHYQDVISEPREPGMTPYLDAYDRLLEAYPSITQENP